MKVISKRKPKQNGWTYLGRCGNEECNVVLECCAYDIYAEQTGYDSDFNCYDYSYYFRCPECGSINYVSGWHLPSAIKQFAELNSDRMINQEPKNNEKGKVLKRA